MKTTGAFLTENSARVGDSKCLVALPRQPPIDSALLSGGYAVSGMKRGYFSPRPAVRPSKVGGYIYPKHVVPESLTTLRRFAADMSDAEAFCLSRDPHAKFIDGIHVLPWQQGLVELGLGSGGPRSRKKVHNTL